MAGCCHEQYSGLGLAVLGLAALVATDGFAASVTDPNDPRSWQGATVGTFAALYYGSNTLANRQQVINNNLLDDGTFNFAGSTPSTIITTDSGSAGTSIGVGPGDYNYVLGGSPTAAGNAIDASWLQTSSVIGGTVWDLGAPATNAAVFNTIDHGPLPLEAIESTVYLSKTGLAGSWVQAVTLKVWLEGYSTGIDWDGFVYAVGTGTNDTFRYATIIWGGPGGLQADGDNEINGILALDANLNTIPQGTPVPAALPLFATGLGALGLIAFRRKRNKAT